MLLEAVSPTSQPKSNSETTSSGEADAVGRISHASSPADSFFRELVLSMRNGVLAIRRDGTIAVINDSARRILALTHDLDLQGRHYTDVLGPGHRFTQVFDSAFDVEYLPNRSESVPFAYNRDNALRRRCRPDCDKFSDKRYNTGTSH